MAEIGVVLPAFNGQRYLAETISSAIAQTWRAFALVVVDDGSRDATGEIAEGFARSDPRVTVHHQANQGVAGARNRGLAHAGGDSRFLLFLDHDDVLEPFALDELRAALVAAPEAVAAYGMPRFIDAVGRVLTPELPQAFGYERDALVLGQPPRPMAPDEPDSFANLVAWPSIASTSQVLIRAEALARAGPFDPAVVPSDDWDMWIRLSLLGPLRRVVRFTVAKREHREGYHHNRAAMRGAEPRLRRKLAASPLLDEAQKRLAHLGQRHGARRRLRWAREHLAKGDWASATSSLAQALRSYVNYLRAR